MLFILNYFDSHIKHTISTHKNTKTKKQLLADLNVLLKNVNIIALSVLTKKNIEKAITIVKDIDEDDYPFVAMHFQYKHKIWSRDQKLINGLTEKGYSHFFITTEELGGHLYKRNKGNLPYNLIPKIN